MACNDCGAGAFSATLDVLVGSAMQHYGLQ